MFKKTSLAWTAVLAALLLGGCSRPEGLGPEITVYKSATCGCCKKWVSHLRDNGFKVKPVDVQDIVSVKKRHGLTPELASCHTALVDGYIVEGHVPAADIQRLLRERPSVKGLAVPGMPVGSPGMEQGGRKDPYTVLSFTAEGETRVYNRYDGSD